MTTWSVTGVRLPFDDRRGDWWIDEHGRFQDQRLPDAERLPGRFFLSGLVDSHAHPAVAPGASGPMALSLDAARTNLVAWAEQGVALIRDVGSPGGLILNLTPDPRIPTLAAAGRFLAPEGRYFPDLLVEPVGEADLVEAARREIGRGASWVKVIGDFPRVPEFVDAAPTYPVELLTSLCEAVHADGARAAVHAVLPDVGRLVQAGFDSIEHGPGLERGDLDEMATRGVAWTPTCCAVLALGDDESSPPERRRVALEAKERLTALLPYAARIGVPVLAGTDVVGTLPREVALLQQLGLEPAQALAAASDTAREFLGVEQHAPNIVTYEHDPREDPAMLEHPVAVVINGIRRR